MVLAVKKGGLIALMTYSMAFVACSLESVPDFSEECPPKGIDADLSFIVLAKDRVCDKDSDCERIYFNHRACPQNMVCQKNGSGDYYCMNRCDGDMIACNGTCVRPAESNDFCGASGGCFSDDPESNDFKGNKCPDAQACIDGQCACKGDSYFFEGACFPNSIEHCGGRDKHCEQLEGWLEGNCEAGKCVASKCLEDYVPIGDQCEKSECTQGYAKCFDTKTWLVCENGRIKKESCPEGQSCYHDKCGRSDLCEPGDESFCTDESTVLVCDAQTSVWVSSKCRENERCYEGACYHNSLCNDEFCQEIYPPGEACDKATFEDRCHPNGRQLIQCLFDETKNAFVYEHHPCGDRMICRDSSATCVCDPEQPPVCADDRMRYMECSNETGEFELIPCANGEICNGGICNPPGAACDSTQDCPTSYQCVEGTCLLRPECQPGYTKDSCSEDKLSLRSCNAKGLVESTPCPVQESCDVDDLGVARCTPKNGKSCDSGTFESKCYLIDGLQYVEECIYDKVLFHECRDNTYCAQAKDSVAGCYLDCSDTYINDTTCIKYAALNLPTMGVCSDAIDVSGVSRKVYVSQPAICDASGSSLFCHLDGTTYFWEWHVPCEDYSPSLTCDKSTGLCGALASCSAPGAFCVDGVAQNCVPDPRGDGTSYILLSNACGVAPCDIYSPTGLSSFQVAECYREEVLEGMTYSTLGACGDDGAIKRMVSSTDFMTMSCFIQRLEGVSQNGVKFCYCAVAE